MLMGTMATRSFQFGLLEAGAVALITLSHRNDIGLGAGEGDLIHEGGTVGGGSAGVPFEQVAAAGIVVGEGIRDGIISPGVALEQFFEVPGAGQSIRDRIKTKFVVEVWDVFGVSPFAGGVFTDLHQSNFLGLTASFWIKAALAPDDSFDQRWIYAVTLGRHTDGGILAVLQSGQPPDAKGSHEKQAHEQDCDAD